MARNLGTDCRAPKKQQQAHLIRPKDDEPALLMAQEGLFFFYGDRILENSCIAHRFPSEKRANCSLRYNQDLCPRKL